MRICPKYCRESREKPFFTAIGRKEAAGPAFCREKTESGQWGPRFPAKGQIHLDSSSTTMLNSVII
jgi:hypothetical protein